MTVDHPPSMTHRGKLGLDRAVITFVALVLCRGLIVVRARVARHPLANLTTAPGIAGNEGKIEAMEREGKSAVDMKKTENPVERRKRITSVISVRRTRKRRQRNTLARSLWTKVSTGSMGFFGRAIFIPKQRHFKRG